MALKSKSKNEKPTPETFVFSRANYQIMIASIIMVVVGFLLMIGKSNIYSFSKITLSPIIVVAGFALGVYSILKKPKINP